MAELKAKMAAKKALKEEQDKQELKQSEKIRRTAGKDITDVQERLKDKVNQKLQLFFRLKSLRLNRCVFMNIRKCKSRLQQGKKKLL